MATRGGPTSVGPVLFAPAGRVSMLEERNGFDRGCQIGWKYGIRATYGAMRTSEGGASWLSRKAVSCDLDSAPTFCAAT